MVVMRRRALWTAARASSPDSRRPQTDQRLFEGKAMPRHADERCRITQRSRWKRWRTLLCARAAMLAGGNETGGLFSSATGERAVGRRRNRGYFTAGLCRSIDVRGSGLDSGHDADNVESDEACFGCGLPMKLERNKRATHSDGDGKTDRMPMQRLVRHRKSAKSSASVGLPR
jgi:hypothetical protein